MMNTMEACNVTQNMRVVVIYSYPIDSYTLKSSVTIEWE